GSRRPGSKRRKSSRCRAGRPVDGRGMSATYIEMFERGQVVVPLIHLGLAAGVTIHVLLTKRDAGSSVAWIGLSWLAPILGSVLYLLLGINRVRRRAQSLRRPRPATRAQMLAKAAARSDHLAALDRAGQRITGRPAEDGNSISILHNGDATYPQMLAAIESAQQTVALSSYIFRADV